MRRNNKPNLQLYTPGSGPLRKSDHCNNETDVDSKFLNRPHVGTEVSNRQNVLALPSDSVADSVTSKLSELSVSGHRKSKKPEQSFYVPTPVAKARQFEQKPHLAGKQADNQNEHNVNGNSDQMHSARNKRFSNRNKPGDPQSEWRSTSPRNYRQGSEPRFQQPANPSGPWNRARDTRSVEPQATNANNSGGGGGRYNNDHHTKPPSGRRHSTIGPDSDNNTGKRLPAKNIDDIPPRFRKLYAMSAEEAPPPTTTTAFRHPAADYTKPCSYVANQHMTANNMMYCTLPNSRPRGRGRLVQEYDHGYNMGRSMTPDKFINSPQNSRPSTPISYRGRTRSSESLNRPESRSQTPVNAYDRPYLEEQNRHQITDDRRVPLNRNEDRDRIVHRNVDERQYNSRSFSGSHRDGANRNMDSNKPNLEDRQYGFNRNSEGRSLNPPRSSGFNRATQERQFKSNRADKSSNTNSRRHVGVSEDSNARRNNDRATSEKPYNNEGWHNDNRRSARGRNGDRTPNIPDTDRSSDESKIDQLSASKKTETPEQATSPSKGFSESLEAQLSPVSPPTPEVRSRVNLLPVDDVLDWSEEVEQHIGQEALSDAMTRSSSLTSLMETSTKSLPPPITKTKSKKKRKSSRRDRNKRSGSNHRDRSADNSNAGDYNRGQSGRQRHPDSFRRPEQPTPQRRRSRDNRERSFERRNRSRNVSRESSFDRNRKSSCSEQESTNWREEMRKRSEPPIKRDVVRRNMDTIERDLEVKTAGLLHLPHPKKEVPKPPVLHLNELSRKPATKKSLFDPHNPNKPIIVNKPSNRVNCPGFTENEEAPALRCNEQCNAPRLPWHNEDSARLLRDPQILQELQKADYKLSSIISAGHTIIQWDTVVSIRKFFMQSLEYLLCNFLKFSQTENIEMYFWKVLFHNIIEMTRKAIVIDIENRDQYKVFLLNIIDEGVKYYESLLELLETTYKFKHSDYTGSNSHQKADPYVNLALIAAQKILICLGDLFRYKEQVNETSNYGKCRQLYITAHEINTKNGVPYNRLAVLAVCSRKKLDAVYYYMRSLMSTNPAPSARESLVSLLDDNRKKYEHSERKRMEERNEKQRLHMKEKESQGPGTKPGSVRKETWIRPDGRRVHRTTTTPQEHKDLDLEEEDLTTLTSVEVNKRFVTSYIHVYGKLITKIGMETFQETALQMLKEFRALLQHSPVPLTSTRFLQLLALNMFAIDTTQLKDPQMQSGYRSELQERALVVSLQMFSLILEKCISLLGEHLNSAPANVNVLPPDAHELLPAVKIWCDWMICHSSIWNPPPSTQDFKVGPSGDAWSRLAVLMNLLKKLDQSIASQFTPVGNEEAFEVRLPEDNALSGFTPLIFNAQEPSFVSKNVDMEAAQFALRVSKILFFGTMYLCGLERPVLKLEFRSNDFSEYVSVVSTTTSRSSPSTPPEIDENELVLEESCSDEEGGAVEELKEPPGSTSTEIQELLSRKVELEKRQRDQELHRQTVQKILQQSTVSVHIEVKPKNLVPDTNCFIDYLSMLKTIACSNIYTLMVPLVVLNELEGLAKGLKNVVSTVDPLHAAKVAESAKAALEFLANKHPSVKCITTKGTVLTSMTFTKEDDTLVGATVTNDDRILATCMILCKEKTPEQVAGEPRKLLREVVLLTDDRNLRVKALTRDVPVREVRNFLQWAGLG